MGHALLRERDGGLVVAKDGKDILFNWCVMNGPWTQDPELDKRLKQSSPFSEVKEKVLPRFEFE